MVLLSWFVLQEEARGNGGAYSGESGHRFRGALPSISWNGLSISGLLKKVLAQEVPPGDDPFDLIVFGDDGQA